MQGPGSPTLVPDYVVPIPVASAPIKKGAAKEAVDSGAPVPVSTLKKLLALAILFSLIFMYVFFTNVSHDPLWWQHAGITHETRPPEHVHPQVLEHALNKVPDPAQDTENLKTLRKSKDDTLRERYGKPVNGSAFLADYDVSKVIPLEAPPLSKEHPQYSFQYMNKSSSKFRFEWLSAQPMVAWVPNFLTDAECDAIIAEASKTMVRSQVVPYKDSKEQNTVNDVRTSSQTWLGTESPAVRPIVHRIFDLTGFPEGSSEMLQVLRYEIGQKYDAHLDYFDPKLYGRQTSNRAVTVFIYLSTVEEGGYTQFPRAQGKPPTWDFKSCEAGLKVRPVKGTLAIFYDMKPNGEYDDYSLHGGCKPVKGTKWAGTLWLRVPVNP